MEQVPVAIIVAVLPEMMQMLSVVPLNVTGKPELADATRLMVAPSGCVGIDAKVTVWLSFEEMVKVCVTGVAAA